MTKTCTAVARLYRIAAQAFVRLWLCYLAQMLADQVFGILNLGHWNLPFDLAQGGELVEPFDIWFLVLGIFIKQATFVHSVNCLFLMTGH